MGFAIIEDGGRQYQVAPGQSVVLDYRKDAEEGSTLTLDAVLLANDGEKSVIGEPTIDGASVEVEVVNALQKGPKLEVVKFRRRKNSRRHTGHRQKHTTFLVKSITVPGLDIKQAPVEEPAATEPAAEESTSES